MRVHLLFALALTVSGNVTVVSADDTAGVLPEWNLYGSNTLRVDHYDVYGPGAQSPYPFEGPMIYDEFGLSLDHQDCEYARWRGQIFGVLNANEYRSSDDDLVPEVLNLTREAGDGVVPYRWELGDYFSYQSYMTQQRSLKGAQLELQPRFGNRVDSLMVFGGANESQWQDLTVGDNYSSGASYLLNSETLGAWSFNAVYNHRSGRALFGELDRDQVVTSAAVERTVAVARQQITFEGEYAHFDGDHDGLTDVASGQSRTGKGYFMELRGFSDALPLDYRLRGERYTKNFRPHGGVVSADRRSAEMHAGWRFDSGLNLRGRYQLYDDLFQTGAEIETRVGGANLSGPLLASLAPNLIGQVDFFVQTRGNPTRTIDLRTINLAADFTQPLAAGWFGRLGLFAQDFDDRTLFDADNDTWQATLGADHAFALGPLSGMISPGMMVRLLRDTRPQGDEFQPTLAFALGYQEHSVGFNYGTFIQERLDTGTTDVNTHTVTADYRYTRARHVFGAELNFLGFNPIPV
ncbi:MAG: hypothetical protein EXR86_04255 [Gammaproteobacteria bacterium]|nr:hypothetical protein [Gammaproteobacteria bacterium]